MVLDADGEDEKTKVFGAINTFADVHIVYSTKVLADEHDLDESKTNKPLLDVEGFREVLWCSGSRFAGTTPH